MPLIYDMGTCYLNGRGNRVYAGYPVLLNGRGGPLPDGFDPHVIEIAQAALDAGIARNSAGELFTNQQLIPSG